MIIHYTIQLFNKRMLKLKIQPPSKGIICPLSEDITLKRPFSFIMKIYAYKYEYICLTVSIVVSCI